MNANLLDVETVAQLEGITERAVQKKIKDGKYGVVTRMNGVGRGGLVYGIPVSNLDDSIKMKYFEDVLNVTKRESAPTIALDSIPDQKIKEVDRKMEVLEAWWQFERQAKEAGTVSGRLIDDFLILWNHQHPQNKPVKRSTLYSWEQKAKGRNKHLALIDQRGGHNKGDTVIPEDTWSKFLQLYLTEEQKSMRICHMFIEMEASLKQVSIPSYSTFKVHVSRIPEPILCKYRQGETAYKQKYLTYILRDPSNLRAGQWWVADHRRFDIMVVRPNGKTYRPWVTAYMDVRTRRLMATVVSESPNADTILLCFRKAAKRFGLPEDVYVDNGRDFCALDMVGSSNRWKNEIQPALMRDLEINMHFSIPREPSGKTIERAFLDVKNHFDRCFSTFVGGTTQERPEGLSKRLEETDNVVTEAEFIELVETYVEFFHNERPHGGIGMNGKSPRQLYDELAAAQPKRMLTEAQARYLLLRTERKRKVGRNGLDMLEGQYYCDDLHAIKGQYVYAKYDPEDVSQVYVYDEQLKFLFIAARRGVANFGQDEVTKEVIRAARGERKRAKRLDDQWKEQNMREEAEPNVIKRVLETAKAVKEQSDQTDQPVVASNVVQLMPHISGKDIQKIKQADEAGREREVEQQVVGARERGIKMAEMMRLNEYLQKQVNELKRD